LINHKLNTTGHQASVNYNKLEPQRKPDMNQTSNSTFNVNSAESIDETMVEQPDKGDSASATKDNVLDSDPIVELGGRHGLEPTRYGDWEKNGRCIDF